MQPMTFGQLWDHLGGLAPGHCEQVQGMAADAIAMAAGINELSLLYSQDSRADGWPTLDWMQSQRADLHAAGMSLPEIARLELPALEAAIRKLRKKPQEPQGKKATVNARMLDTISKDEESKGWSIRKWAAHLGCVISTVQKQPAWKALQVMSVSAQLSKAKPKDRSRHRGRTINSEK